MFYTVARPYEIIEAKSRLSGTLRSRLYLQPIKDIFPSEAIRYTLYESSGTHDRKSSECGVTFVWQIPLGGQKVSDRRAILNRLVMYQSSIHFDDRSFELTCFVMWCDGGEVMMLGCVVRGVGGDARLCVVA